MLSISSTDTVISIEGHYTAAVLMDCVAKLKNEIQQANAAKDLNLSQLTGSDSGLIAALLMYQRMANELGWNARLINVNDGIKGLIKLGQLEDFFVLNDS